MYILHLFLLSCLLIYNISSIGGDIGGDI